MWLQLTMSALKARHSTAHQGFGRFASSTLVGGYGKDASPERETQAFCIALAGLIDIHSMPRIPSPAAARAFTLGFAVPRLWRWKLAME
jgi:hypothetical protein